MIGGVELRKQRNLGDIVSDAFTTYLSRHGGCSADPTVR